MLAVSTAARLTVKGATRAVVVAGQRQATVQTVRRAGVRGIQSVAQTDRVCFRLLISLTGCPDSI